MLPAISMPIARSLLLTTLLVLVLSGCSSTRTAYRFADWGIVWWVDDYVRLTSAQETQLDQDLNAFLQWHCSAELPRYTQWLDQLEADMANETPSLATVRYHQTQLTGFVNNLLGQAVPVTVRLLETFSDEQVNQLATNMAEQHQELEEEMLEGSVQENTDARAERTRERLERWLGELNKPQEALVADWSAERGRQTEIWLAGRRNWQKALVASLEARDQPGFGARIEDLIVNYEQARGAEYQAMSVESQAAMAVLIQDLLAVGGPEHREHIINEAGKLNGDFTALTCL